MIVFKTYFKIVLRNLGLIIMFASIAISISVANTRFSEDSEVSYLNDNPKLAIINNDTSNLSKDFVRYIKDNSKEIVNVENNEKDIQDALYNNKVDAILIIPSDFTTRILNKEEPKIEINKSVKNYSKFSELLVNRYFKIASIYAKCGMNEEQIISKVNEDIQKQIDAQIMQNKKSANIEKLAIFYNFENYAFLSIFIFVIGNIMCVFNEENISKRNSVSKLKKSSFSLQLFLGHLCLTFLLWLIFVIISIIIYKDLMFSLNGLLLMINSLLFAICATSIAYLIGTLIKKRNVISGIQNVVSLGLSFISGCFVSADLLDKNILNFSKIFPSYWFIQSNTKIVKLTSFSFENLSLVLRNFVIIIGFTVIYYIASRIFKSSKKV